MSYHGCEVPKGFYQVPYAPGYYVDKLGRVGSTNFDFELRILKQRISRDGARLEVNLTIDGVKKMLSVARIVMDGNIGVLKTDYKTIFKNGNPFDCSVKNLERIPIVSLEKRLKTLPDWVTVPAKWQVPIV